MEPGVRPRGIIKRDRVQVEDGGAPAAAVSPPRAAPSASPACARAPAVTLVQLDGGAQAFEFTCSCGEVSLIEIQHEAKS
jgi:hypothetical protein